MGLKLRPLRTLADLGVLRNRVVVGDSVLTRIGLSVVSRCIGDLLHHVLV